MDSWKRKITELYLGKENTGPEADRELMTIWIYTMCGMWTHLRDQMIYADEKGKIYCSIFTFKEDDPNVKRMANIFRKGVVCKKRESNRYELLTEECLEIHNLLSHEDEQFKDGHRAIKHKYRKENKSKCSRENEEINEYLKIESF